jgi:hypothetical protein
MTGTGYRYFSHYPFPNLIRIPVIDVFHCSIHKYRGFRRHPDDGEDFFGSIVVQ